MGEIKIALSKYCYYSGFHLFILYIWIKVLGFFLEVNHLEQQLEEANSVRRELDDAFRQIKAFEKQIKTLQQERDELNKVCIYEWVLTAVSTCFIFYN